MYKKSYVQEQFYAPEIATEKLSKIYFLKNAKKQLNHLNHDWIKPVNTTSKENYGK